MYSRNALRFLCLTSVSDGIVWGHSNLCAAKVQLFFDICKEFMKINKKIRTCDADYKRDGLVYFT